MISNVTQGAFVPLQQTSSARSEAVREQKTSESSLSPKAAAIAEKLAAGTYKLDMKATAQAMAKELSC